MTALDPAADPARRVWQRCTPCGSNSPLYLLEAAPRYVWVQCPDCFARWWLDTGCGVGRPARINAEPDWPLAG